MKTVRYDKAAADRAFARFRREPTALTQDDVDQLALVDPELADSARRTKALLREKQSMATHVSVANAEMIDVPSGQLPTGSATGASAPTLAGLIVSTIDRMVGPLRQRLAMLEAAVAPSIATSSAKPRVRFGGEWAATKQYRPNDAVVCNGRLWRCDAHVIGVPPEGSTSWQQIDQPDGR